MMRFVKAGLMALSGFSFCATAAQATMPIGTAGSDDVVQVQLVDDIGASERVEAAAILRVLTQEVASAACHVGYGIGDEESRKLLLEAKAKFGMLLDALQYGNPAMNIIGAEERRKTTHKIDALRTQWAPLYDAAVTLLDNPADTDALKVIKAGNEAVLATTFDLTSELAGQYSNPAELLQADVMLLDFAGRQALLTQKIAKISCEIWSGNTAADRLDLLDASIKTYEATLNALQNGMPSVGIIAAPTPQIEATLASASAAWEPIKAKLNMVLTENTVSDADKTTLYVSLNAAMYQMEDVEHMYVKYSKHKYD